MCRSLEGPGAAVSRNRLYPADRVVESVGEPEGAGGPARDSVRVAGAGVGGVGDDAARVYPADRVVEGVGEPEGAVRPRRNPIRAADAGIGVVRNDAARGD